MATTSSVPGLRLARPLVVPVVLLGLLTAACGGGSGSAGASSSTPARTSGSPSVAPTAPLLPAGFPAHVLSYTLTKPYQPPSGGSVFPGKYVFTVSQDGSAVLHTADGHDVAMVIHADGTDRVQLLQEGGAPTLGNFRWTLAGPALTFSDYRPGLETSFDRYFMASPFTVG